MRDSIIHAELGLVLLTGESLLVAALLLKLAPGLFLPVVSVTPRHLAYLAALPLLAPTLAAYFQHRTECLAFRVKKSDVVKELKLMGFTK